MIMRDVVQSEICLRNLPRQHRQEAVEEEGNKNLDENLDEEEVIG